MSAYSSFGSLDDGDNSIINITIHTLFSFEIINSLPTINHYAFLYYYDHIYNEDFYKRNNNFIENLNDLNRAKYLLADKYLKVLFRCPYNSKFFTAKYDGNIELLNTIIKKEDKTTIINRFRNILNLDISRLKNWPYRLDGDLYKFDIQPDLLNCIKLIDDGCEIVFNVFYESKNNTIGKKLLNMSQMLLNEINSNHDEEIFCDDAIIDHEGGEDDDYEEYTSLLLESVIEKCDKKMLSWNIKAIHKILSILCKISSYNITREENLTRHELVDKFQRIKYLMHMYRKYDELKKENDKLKKENDKLKSENDILKEEKNIVKEEIQNFETTISAEIKKIWETIAIMQAKSGSHF